ncbi:MAG TPA: hypothetical protein VF980_16210 [Thermoanaerobaculia bacterium]
MKPVFIGTAADARGFALAGVETHVCESRPDIEKELEAVTCAIADPLLIFSKSAAELIAGRCAQWRRSGTGPLFVALPG